MIRSAALLCIFVSLVAIAAAYVSAFLPGGVPGWAAWAMALGTSAMLVALMALGAVRRDRLGWLWVPFALTFLVLAGGLCLALSMSGAPAPEASLWLGLPRSAAVILYGVGLLPFLFVPAAYALSFDEMTLSDSDLARISDALAARGAEPPSPWSGE